MMTWAPLQKSPNSASHSTSAMGDSMANPYLQKVTRDVCVHYHDNNHNSIALETITHFAEMAVADDERGCRVDELERTVRT